ncbi:MAG: hypothetical protein ACRDGL_03050, partial [Candidatus Limnocylindrales bacterium]
MAYAGDCRVAGRIQLTRGRLTDMLNDQPTLHLHEVLLEGLEDGRLLELADIELQRDELFAVEALGPRGKADKRVRTRPHRMQVSLGPYIVMGQLHTMPGADPLNSMLRRMPMVPLTTATIGYAVAGQTIMRDVETLVVNRSLADWISPTSREQAFFPNTPIVVPAPGEFFAKDLTGPLDR